MIMRFFTGNGSNCQIFVTFQRNAFYTFRQLDVRQVKDVAGNDLVQSKSKYAGMLAGKATTSTVVFNRDTRPPCSFTA